jgi:hypothetical protein
VNKNKDIIKIQAAEMKFLRHMKECTKLDNIKNEDIHNEMHIHSANGRTEYCREKWLTHFNRMHN